MYTVPNCVPCGFPIRFYAVTVYGAYGQVKLQNYIVIHNSQFIRSLSCISSYMFRLVYIAIFTIVFRVVCMYKCSCFERDEISYYK